jgi:molybdenum cofactor cytidylyltransferase
MGQPKLLLPWGHSTVIEQVLAAWRASAIDHVVLVVHPEDAALADLGRKCGALVVQPEVPPPQMKASIRAGLAEIERRFRPAADDGWLLAPADMPRLSAAAIDAVLRAYDPLKPTAVVPAFEGRRGHPLLMPWSSAALVDRLGRDEGVNSLLAQMPVREVAWPEPSILQDLDTPQEFARLAHGRGRPS